MWAGDSSGGETLEGAGSFAEFNAEFGAGGTIFGECVCASAAGIFAVASVAQKRDKPMQYRAQTDTPHNGLPDCCPVKRGRADRIAVKLALSRLNVARTLPHGSARFNKSVQWDLDNFCRLAYTPQYADLFRIPWLEVFMTSRYDIFEMIAEDDLMLVRRWKIYAAR